MAITTKEITIKTGIGAIFSFATTIGFGILLATVNNSDLQKNSLLTILILLSFVYLAVYLLILSGSIGIVEKFQKTT